MLCPRENSHSIRFSQKFLSFYKKVIDAQHFLFYIMIHFVLLVENGSYKIQQNNIKEKMLRIYYFLIKQTDTFGTT